MDIVHIVLFEFCEPRQIVPLYLADVGQVLRGWTWGLGSVSTGSVGLQSLNLEFERKGSLFKGRWISPKILFFQHSTRSLKKENLKITPQYYHRLKRNFYFLLLGGGGSDECPTVTRPMSDSLQRKQNKGHLQTMWYQQSLESLSKVAGEFLGLKINLWIASLDSKMTSLVLP